MSTAYSRIVALDAETGNKIWEYESQHSPALRGIAYWPGTKTLPPQIVFGTGDGWLISLNAKTGKPVPGFGVEGLVNLKAGVADKFPNLRLGMSSPPSIYKDLVITGSTMGEMPALGPSGAIRAWEMHTGKLVWTFHSIPQPGEPNHEVWQGDQWAGRSGVNSWGFTTVDVKRGILLVPIGTPNTDFYGGDRKGSNLYGTSLVALDARTGKLRWCFQTTHHDNWDYDLSAAPILITIKQNGQKVPAVAQITKQGYLFLFNRLTGKPIFDTNEVPVAGDNPTPGDENWPTQPIPVKPPPLARTTFKPEEIATVTPEHEKYCRELLSREGGALTGGPFAHYGPKLRVIFPSWTGGSNWGGGSFDPQLGYVFVDTKSLANFNKLITSADSKGYVRVGPDNPPLNMGDYFLDGTKQWPCQQPPWGELAAVNTGTGEIDWRVPLGSFEELDKLGVPKTGTPTTNGGSIATAGGLVFIGATVDGKFRAFESRTGRELWVTDLGIDVNSVPITWVGKNGKQHVAVFASHGTAHAGRLLVTRCLRDAWRNMKAALFFAFAALVGAQSLPEGSGKAVVERMCKSCHGLDNIVRARMGKERWSNVVDDMVSRGATGSDSEIDEVIDYLSTNFGAVPRRVNVNKAAAEDLATVMEISVADAGAIVHYHSEKGAFKSLQDLGKVPGIDAKKIETAKDRLEF